MPISNLGGGEVIRDLTAAERMNIARLLGRPVIETADALRVRLNNAGEAPAWMWRAFLQALMEGAGDAMSSPIGIAIQLAIVGKINSGETNANDTSECRNGKPSGGFPSKRQW